jgi:hypothetical protein
MFQESGPVSYMRKALALRFMEELRVPAAAARHVRLRQNGAFYGLYLMVEQVDKVFLARKGLAPHGRLFKAAHWKYSNLRQPDMANECPFTAPDYDYWPRGTGRCPIIFSEAGGNLSLPAPHLREVEALALAVNAGDLRGFDLDAVVTEMAAQAAMLHHDRCTKNRFYHHDPASGRWTVIPYDMKDAFATDNRGSGRDCAREGNPCGNAETYCILSCDAFNSPFYCDAAHPQDTFPESDGRSTYNHLVDAVLKQPAARAAYLAKLRWIMDTCVAHWVLFCTACGSRGADVARGALPRAATSPRAGCRRAWRSCTTPSPQTQRRTTPSGAARRVDAMHRPLRAHAAADAAWCAAQGRGRHRRGRGGAAGADGGAQAAAVRPIRLPVAQRAGAAGAPRAPRRRRGALGAAVGAGGRADAGAHGGGWRCGWSGHG